MIKIKQAVIVEGKYDKARLSGILDADIYTTGGFAIFHDQQRLAFFKDLAQTRGLVLLTDSDAAGFRIRNFIANVVGADLVTHVYIPDLFGKERRKPHPGAEGKLGVEGVPDALLLEAFKQAHVVFNDEKEITSTTQGQFITTADLLAWGLTGDANSVERRRTLLVKLGLPARLNIKTLLRLANDRYDYDTFSRLAQADNPGK